MIVLHNPNVLLHDTIELLGAKLIPALESPKRILAILSTLQESEYHVQIIDDSEIIGNLQDCIRTTHDASYIDHLQHSHDEWVTSGSIDQDGSILPECFPVFSMPHHERPDRHEVAPPKDMFARSSYYAFDLSSGIMKDTYTSAIASAGLAYKAASLLSTRRDFDDSKEEEVADPSPAKGQTIMCLCRPPGHHCDTKHAGGYCYLNNALICVEALLTAGAGSRSHVEHDDTMVGVLDLDFHHGNGTQSYFYDRKVTYASIHGQNEYPYYSGHASETGRGLGKGYNHNFPLPSGTSVSTYLHTLDRALDHFEWTRLQFLVISLGFDTFHLDPLGSFKIYGEDYAEISRRIASRTSAYGIRTVILLEGGYYIAELGLCLLSFLRGWKTESS